MEPLNINSNIPLEVSAHLHTLPANVRQEIVKAFNAKEKLEQIELSDKIEWLLWKIESLTSNISWDVFKKQFFEKNKSLIENWEIEIADDENLKNRINITFNNLWEREVSIIVYKNQAGETFKANVFFRPMDVSKEEEYDLLKKVVELV